MFDILKMKPRSKAIIPLVNKCATTQNGHAGSFSSLTPTRPILTNTLQRQTEVDALRGQDWFLRGLALATML